MLTIDFNNLTYPLWIVLAIYFTDKLLLQKINNKYKIIIFSLLVLYYIGFNLLALFKIIKIVYQLQNDFGNLPFTVEEKIEVKGLIEDYNSKPEYLKNNIQTSIQELDLKINPTIPEQINGLMEGVTNGVKSKAAMPAWMASVSAASSYLMFAMGYYSQVVYSKCAMVFWWCVLIIYEAIDKGYTLYQIRNEFFK